ncbi:MAG: alginate lyase family protein [Victivallales bacterium]|nr:alginate lyase family protein [Victivallales bacterium]
MHMRSFIMISMLAASGIAVAQTADPLVIVSPQDPATWQGGELDESLSCEISKGSIRWEHAKSHSLTFKGFPTNWKGDWNLLEVWLYSPESFPQTRFLLYIGSENNSKSGPDYYSQQIRLDFKGWKRFIFPLERLQRNRQPVGFHHITDVHFAATGFFNTLNPKAVVNVGSIRLIQGEVPPMPKGPRLSDDAFYAALDLDLQGLEDVKAAVEKRDYKQAGHALAAYLKQRETPRMPQMWKDRPTPEERKPQYNTHPADEIVAHRLTSCEFTHQFGERIEWLINPTPLKYNEWTWQLNRHPFWNTLVDAYWQTGDEKYGKEFVNQMRGWVEDCLVPEAGSGNAPYSAWRTITTGIRTFGPWPNCFFRMLGSPVFDDDSIVLMVKSFYEHARHLRANPTRNNWLAMEMNGLFHIAVLFPEFKESQEWRDYAIGRIYKELDLQVYPDGAQKELAPGYHGVSLGNFLGLYNIGKLNNVKMPEDYCQRLERMYQYYMNIRMPDGRCPALNDSLWGQTAGVLTNGQRLFPNRTDFLYAATYGAQGTAPSFTSVWMPYAGWAVMRTGWDTDAMYMHVDVGPFGAGHQHEDKLSIIAAAYGRKILTEGACYAYDVSQYRRYTLAAAAHNIVNVDGKPQHRRGKAEYNVVEEPLQNRWRSDDVVDFIEGRYDEGFGDNNDKTVTHYRAVLFVKPQYWLVFDVLSPKDAAEHAYESMFHLANVEAVLNEKTMAVRGCDENVPNIAILPIKADGLTATIVKGKEDEPAQGWELRSGYYDKHAIPTALYNRKAAGQWLEPWLLYPLKANETQPPVQSLRMTTPNTIELQFTDGRVHVVELTLDGDGISKLSLILKRADGSIEAAANVE